MEIIIRVKPEYAYETGVILNAHKLYFECDIPDNTKEIRYIIWDVCFPSIQGEYLYFGYKNGKCIKLHHIRSMSVFG